MSQISFDEFKAKLIKFDASYGSFPESVIHRMYEDKHSLSAAPVEVPSRQLTGTNDQKRFDSNAPHIILRSAPVDVSNNAPVNASSSNGKDKTMPVTYPKPITYHLWINDAAQGPFTIGQLRAMWNSGQITAETSYTTDAGGSWHHLAELQDTLEIPITPQNELAKPVNAQRVTEISRKKSFGLSFWLILLLGILFSGAGAFGYYLHWINENDPHKEWIVKNGWDGSVYQARDWLKANLNDPQSLEILEWSPVERTAGGDGYIVHCNVRAKNSFGALVVQTYRFNFDGNGNVEFGGTDDEFYQKLNDSLRQNTDKTQNDSTNSGSSQN